MASSLTSTLGEEVFGKIFDAINSNGFNVLEDLTFGTPDPLKSIRLAGRTADKFWDSLIDIFGIDITDSSQFQVGPPLRFKVPGTSSWVNQHISSTNGEITIEIGNIKFRF